MVFFVRKEPVEIMFAGLGNPGAEYETTKHNVGFRALDAFAQEHFTRKAFQKNLGALLLKEKFHEHPLLLAKPQQYMNRSGLSIKWLLRKYPADDLVIIYDDMDLPPGRIRLAPGGRPAGHRGMESIVSSIRTDEIKRIRIGIGGRGDMEGAEYVLTPFTGADVMRIENAISITVKAMEAIILDGFERAMNNFNRRDIDEIIFGSAKSDDKSENEN